MLANGNITGEGHDISTLSTSHYNGLVDRGSSWTCMGNSKYGLFSARNASGLLKMYDCKFENVRFAPAYLILISNGASVELYDTDFINVEPGTFPPPSIASREKGYIGAISSYVT